MRNGQALIIVLLVLGVVLTIGLAIVSRSVTEVRVSTTQEESLRALEAAEAGIERALGGVIAIGEVSAVGSVPTTQATFNVSNVSMGAGQYYQSPFLLEGGDVLTVALDNGATADLTGVHDICWGNPGSSAAIEVMLYYDQGGTVGVVRKGFDSNALVNDNGFVRNPEVSNSPCSIPGSNYQFSLRGVGVPATRNVDFVGTEPEDLGMPVGATPLFMRIRMFYNTTPEPIGFAAISGQSFPSQASQITSTGQSGDSVQKVSVYQANPDLPFMFDAALFSGTSLTQ